MFRLLMLLALVPYAVLVWVHWDLGPVADSGDYAQYLLHAKALAEGRSYGDIGYIYTPEAFAVGPRVQPPGFPLTIVPIVAALGVSTPLLKVFVVLMGAGLLVLSGAYVSRLAGAGIGAATAAVAGVALEAGYATNTVLPDLGFGALLWAIFLLMDAPRVATARRVGLVAVLGLAAMSYRAAGLALVPTVALHALLNRERRSAVIAVLGVWLLAAVAVLALAPDAIPFSSVLLPKPEQVLQRLGGFIDAYWRPVLSAQLYPLPGDLPNDVFHILSSFFLVVGAGIALWRHRAGVIWAFLVGYAVMLAVAPVRDGRYLWPLFPLVAFFLLLGVRESMAVVRKDRGATGLAATALAVLLVSAASVRALRQPAPATLAEDASLQAMFEWFRGAGRREARVMFANPRVLTLETGAHGIAILPSSSPDALLSQLERHRVTHVVLGDPASARRGQETLAELIATYPEHFTVVFENPPYRVHQFVGVGIDTASRRSGTSPP